MRSYLLTFFLVLAFSEVSFAQKAGEVAKVIILKGKVFEVTKEGSKKLSKGDWVSQGSVVKSSGRSFLKLLFLDKSQMNLGANSELKIKEFPRNKAGIISLLKGKVRAKVTKNYMEIDKNKSKLFIKTKTAAMGVRGTDFQVVFNPRNKVTSLVTFEGAVAMTKLDSRLKDVQISQNSLETRLNRAEAVIVRQGQYSGSTPGKSRVSVPVKISPTQLESLKSADQVSSNSSSEKSSPQRSIIPPGIDPKKLAEATGSSVENALEASVGSDNLKKVENSTKDAILEARQSGPPPEGFEDRKTGAYAPAAGGYVDTKTGLYIPPSSGSSFDANAGVYVPNPEVGTVDAETGEYVPPKGFEPLLVDGSKVGFKDISENGRGPASVGGGAKVKLVEGLGGSIGPITQVPDNSINPNDLPDFRDKIRANEDRNAVIIQTGRARVNFRISR